MRHNHRHDRCNVSVRRGIVINVRRTDEEDYREFVVASSARLGRLARMLSADPHAGEDLLQATLLKTWSSWPRVRKTENPDAYVRRVMVNTAAKGYRRRWRGEVPTDVLPESIRADDTRTVDDRSMLVDAVRRLPPRQRAAVVLRYFLDLSDQDIADSLGCSVATVRSQISRALVTLRVQPVDDDMNTRQRP
jgi:RNA polymerase sigma-70 factor (sigma-E family)